MNNKTSMLNLAEKLSLPHNQELLKTFEIAAEFLSFKAAATQLMLSETSVSHRIKNLEQNLGLSLFIRSTRSLILSAEGKQVLKAYQKAAHAFKTELEESLSCSNNRLHLYSHPSVLHRWLIPRLKSFYESKPELSLHITSGNTPFDFSSDNSVDLALYYAPKALTGLDCIPLMDEKVFAVCSPDYAALHGLTTSNKPLLIENFSQALPQLCFIHDNACFHYSERYLEWRAYCKMLGLAFEDCKQHLSFDTSSNALEAALNGLGVAMGRSHLVLDSLERGDLIAPLGTEPHILYKNAYWIVLPKEKRKLSQVQSFIAWLKSLSLDT